MLVALLAACSYLPELPFFGAKKGPAGPIHVTPPKPQITAPGAQPAPVSADEPPVAMEASNCGDLQDGGPVQGPDCVTQTVTCNSTVFGHTFGGTDNFDSRFYETHRCTPRLTNHDGGEERVYLLEMPEGDHRVNVWMDTPCGDLDLTVMTVPDPKACPKIGDNILKICDMWPKDGKQREHVELATQGATHVMIVVEGKKSEEGAFALTIQCAEGLY